jgi:cold shock protein
MLKGIVIFFNDIIGKGYIKPDNCDQKVFVSYDEIKKSGYKILNEGQKVQFELKSNGKGKFTAINVNLSID